MGWFSGLTKDIFGGGSVSTNIGEWFNNITGATDAYNKSLEQWNRENEYNKPINQMARLKEAGLNPNLVYGNGAQSVSASSPRASSAGAGGLSSLVSSILSIANVYHDLKQKDASTEQIKLNNAMLKKDLKYYDDYGFRPGTNDWIARILGLVTNLGGDDSSLSSNLSSVFGWIKAFSNADNKKKLTAEQQKLYDKYMSSFRR